MLPNITGSVASLAPKNTNFVWDTKLLGASIVTLSLELKLIVFSELNKIASDLALNNNLPDVKITWSLSYWSGVVGGKNYDLYLLAATSIGIFCFVVK